MKLETLGLAALTAMALMAFTAGSASATTLEVNGVAQNKSVEIRVTNETGSSAKIALTNEAFANTCTVSSFELGSRTAVLPRSS